jgi:hypothetical protein
MIYVPWLVFIVGVTGLIWWGFHTKKQISTQNVAGYEAFLNKVPDQRKPSEQHPQDRTQDITEAMVGGGQNQGQGQKWN